MHFLKPAFSGCLNISIYALMSNIAWKCLFKASNMSKALCAFSDSVCPWIMTCVIQLHMCCYPFLINQTYRALRNLRNHWHVNTNCCRNPIKSFDKNIQILQPVRLNCSNYMLLIEQFPNPNHNPWSNLPTNLHSHHVKQREKVNFQHNQNWKRTITITPISATLGL